MEDVGDGASTRGTNRAGMGGGVRQGDTGAKKGPAGEPGEGMVEAGRIELPSADVAPGCLRACSVI